MKFPILKSDLIDIAKHRKEEEKFDMLGWADPVVTEAFDYVREENACPICGSTIKTVLASNGHYERICPLTFYVWDED